MNNLLTAAEKFHALGANILPIRNNKKPLIEWDSLQTNRQTIEILRSYDWARCTGIGIVCGVNGYTCIDIDAAKNDETRKTVLNVLGLEETYKWQVKSGSGKGYHIWIHLDEPLPVKNESGVIKGYSKDGSFKQIEIRWNECQTLLPPSLHTSGNTYEWLYGEPDSEPSTVSTHNLLEAFGKVADLDVKKQDDSKPQFRKSNYVDILMNGVNEGHRNDTLARLAGHFKKHQLDFSETVILTKQWNNRLDKPLPETEVETTVTSIYSYATDTNRLFTGAEMSLMNPTPVNDLIAGIIREQSLNFLAGEEGAGKSLLAMNLALSVATGLSKFLEYDVKQHGKVLYLNNELPFSEFLGRFKTMRSTLSNAQLSNLGNFLTPEFVPPLTEYWDTLCHTIEIEKPKLVVLDCLYWAHDKKENDSSEMKEIMRKLIELRDKFQIALVVVHHTKKGVRNETMHNDNMRGSQVFSASSDSVIQIRRSASDDSIRILKPTKLRHGDDEMRKPRLLSLEPYNLWFRDNGEANEQAHLPVASGSPMSEPAKRNIDWLDIFGADDVLSRSEIVERCSESGMKSRTVDRQLKQAVEKSELTKPKDGQYALASIDTLPLSEAA